MAGAAAVMAGGAASIPAQRQEPKPEQPKPPQKEETDYPFTIYTGTLMVALIWLLLVWCGFFKPQSDAAPGDAKGEK